MSVMQFRTLLFLNRNPGTSPSAVAEHLGLTRPTVTNMIDGMVANRLVARGDSSADRRRVTLSLTTRGQDLLEGAHEGTQARLGEILAGLSPEELEAVHRVMQLLHGLFIPTALQQTVQER